MRDMFEVEDLCRSLLGMHKIKYSVLNEFKIRKDIDAFHINYDSFIRFYSKYYNTNPELYDTDLVYCVAASIINTAAHYRHYFAKHNSNELTKGYGFLMKIFGNKADKDGKRKMFNKKDKDGNETAGSILLRAGKNAELAAGMKTKDKPDDKDKK